MDKNPIDKGVIAENSIEIGPVSREMVQKRALELAVINGRSAQDASKTDWEQAKRELTGGSDMDPQEAKLESLPDTNRWDPVPASTGRQVQESPSEDEDDEGRSESEQLVEQGVAEAEHDHMLKATRNAAKKNK